MVFRVWLRTWDDCGRVEQVPGRRGRVCDAEEVELCGVAPGSQHSATRWHLQIRDTDAAESTRLFIRYRGCEKVAVYCGYQNGSGHVAQAACYVEVKHSLP